MSVQTAQAWQVGAAPKTEEKAKKIPEPINIEIPSKAHPTGKVHMKATYYGSNLGKDAVPILMLHGFEGSRADYEEIALYMQQKGHAVIVPDLRGHGDSTSVQAPNGDKKELLAKKMTANDFNTIVLDIDDIKSLMREKNNNEEFNLEKLVVIGADMSAIAAMNWALHDWTAPQLINYKQGQDVKAIVLLSPTATFKGTNMKTALQHPIVGGKLSTMVVAGKKDSESWNDAKRLMNTLERQHGEVNSQKDPEDKETVAVYIDTNLQGTKLLDKNLKLAPIIAQFIQFRIVQHAENFEYSKRNRP